MGLFGDLWDMKKRKDTCCANCCYFDINRRICKKGLSAFYRQKPYEPCECTQFNKRIF